jgi:hypothetical protein
LDFSKKHLGYLKKHLGYSKKHLGSYIQGVFVKKSKVSKIDTLDKKKE